MKFQDCLRDRHGRIIKYVYIYIYGFEKSMKSGGRSCMVLFHGFALYLIVYFFPVTSVYSEMFALTFVG